MKFQVGKNGTVELIGLQKRNLVFYPDQWLKLSNSLKNNLLSDFLSLKLNIKKTRLSTLEQIASGILSVEEGNEQLNQLKKNLQFHEHKNGTIMLQGLQKRSVILFKDQWIRLSEFLCTDTLTKFLEENDKKILDLKKN